MSRITAIGSMAQYKDSLSKVCYYSSLLQKYADLVDSGKRINKKDAAYAATMLKHYKQFLLCDKSMLGYHDGLTFMEDNKFMGFEIKDGRFLGDRSKVKAIVGKWIENYPGGGANHYQYEVSMLILALAFPDEITELFEAAGVSAAA